MPDFKRPHALTDVYLHYCPGCTHGIVHRLVAEVIDEMNIDDADAEYVDNEPVQTEPVTEEVDASKGLVPDDLPNKEKENGAKK